MSAKPQTSASSPAAATVLKITQIGNSVGVILPKDVLARLKVGKGDSLFVTEVPDGVTLRPYDDTFEAHPTTPSSGHLAIRSRIALRSPLTFFCTLGAQCLRKY